MEALKKQLKTLNGEYRLIREQYTILKSERLQLFHVSQNYINPFLLRSQKALNAIYDNNIIHVTLDNGNTEKFYFDEDKNVTDAFFKSGKKEELIFWFDGRFFNVAKKNDYEQHSINQSKMKDIELQLKNMRVEMHTLEEKINCMEFWAQYKIPFKFIAEIKIVLSGLSEFSNGDGCRKNSVYHVVLKEDFAHGSLKREKNQYLCSQQKGNFIELGDYKKIEDLQQVITCKECLKRIEKYKKALKD